VIAPCARRGRVVAQSGTEPRAGAQRSLEARRGPDAGYAAPPVNGSGEKGGIFVGRVGF
jgi:hypothetical protein